MSAMTKKEWMEYLEKTWDAAQKEAWSEPQFECPRCGHCCRIQQAAQQAVEVMDAMQLALDMLNEIADDVYCDQKLEGVIAVLRQALVDADDTSQKRVDETAKHKHIKTWSERCEEHPDHQERIITERMIQERMQEEIDELRQALERLESKIKEKNHG